MSVQILVGDCIARLRELPADSVHCVVTSPPYWGLRDYGTGTWEGGDAGCDHTAVRRGHGEHEKQATSAGTSRDRITGEDCRKCGARRIDQQIGLEPTPEAWAARLVEVFREVRRVLRPDGCCWVNIGDSYNANQGAGFNGNKRLDEANRSTVMRVPGLKPKDLVGQPWLLAFALRADGWWLRSEIIWAKPNPMPESVRDRPTKAHEQVFLLTKSDRYAYDAEAVREKSLRAGDIPGGNNGRGVDQFGVAPHAPFNGEVPANRNARSVWTIATEPYSEAHFATFPTELARRCILAGTSAKGCCPQCGAPWARVVERGELVARSAGDGLGYELPKAKAANGDARCKGRSEGWSPNHRRETETTGWRPSCACDAGEPVPCLCLDPFGGSGTTGLVAEQLGRDAILIELSPDYAAMAERRLSAARSRRMLGDVERVKPMPGQASLFGEI